MKNLTEQGYSFSAAAEREIARDVKEKPCYISADYDIVLKSMAGTDKKETYELPDRKTSSLLAQNVSVAVKKPAESTTLLSAAS